MITLAEQPVSFAPAYKPVVWGFTSDRFPNTSVDVDQPILAIGAADQNAVNNLPGLVLGEIIMQLVGAIPPPTFQPGQTILLQGTSDGRYDGIQRIIKQPNPNVPVYVLDTDNAEGSVGGTASLYFERYSLIATVQFDGGEPRQYIIDADKDNVFRLDIRDQAQAAFRDVYDLVRVNSPTAIIDAERHITCGYTISIDEGYNVPVGGVNEFAIKPSGFIPPGGKIQVCVNSVQPYHHYNEWSGSVDLDWNDNLVDYVVNNTSTGQRAKRFLTYSPSWDGRVRGVTVGPSDGHFLAFLTDERGPVRLNIQYYNGSTFLSETQSIQTYPLSSGIIPIGPRNLGNLLPSNATSYRVELRTTTGNPITRTYLFNIDRKCHKAPRRLYALNKFGAIDAYTFTGYEKRENANEREVVSRDTMPSRIGKSGDSIRRTWKNLPARGYSIISDTLPKAWLRYVADEILESPDVRTQIHEPRIIAADGPWWTRVILTNTSDPMGFEHGRLSITYRFGIDEEVQTR